MGYLWLWLHDSPNPSTYQVEWHYRSNLHSIILLLPFLPLYNPDHNNNDMHNLKTIHAPILCIQLYYLFPFTGFLVMDPTYITLSDIPIPHTPGYFMRLQIIIFAFLLLNFVPSSPPSRYVSAPSASSCIAVAVHS